MLVFQCTCNYYNGFIHDFYEFSINYFSNIVIRNHLILGLGEQWGKIGRNSLRLSLFKSRMNYLNLRLESTLGQILLRIKSIYTSSLLNLEPAFSFCVPHFQVTLLKMWVDCLQVIIIRARFDTLIMRIFLGNIKCVTILLILKNYLHVSIESKLI